MSKFAKLARRFVVVRVADVIMQQLERLPDAGEVVLKEIIEEVMERLEAKKKAETRKHVENEA
jgi:hypothetical protein